MKTILICLTLMFAMNPCLEPLIKYQMPKQPVICGTIIEKPSSVTQIVSDPFIHKSFTKTCLK